jgi:hypothetical protein
MFVTVKTFKMPDGTLLANESDAAPDLRLMFKITLWFIVVFFYLQFTYLGPVKVS